MFDVQLYRDKAEVEAWRRKEPIVRFRGWLESNRIIRPEEVDQIYRDISAEIDEAVAFAEAGTWEPVEQLTRFAYAETGLRVGRHD